MGDASYGNAMTEIALALAMAFFSLMVLTMVSMGAPATAPDAKTTEGSPVKLTMAPPSPNDRAAEKDKAAGREEILIFWRGGFFDKDLKPVDVAARRFDGPVILALSPELPMSRALAARTKITANNIVVSTLDARWLATLDQALGKE